MNKSDETAPPVVNEIREYLVECGAGPLTQELFDAHYAAQLKMWRDFVPLYDKCDLFVRQAPSDQSILATQLHAKLRQLLVDRNFWGEYHDGWTPGVNWMGLPISMLGCSSSPASDYY